MRAGLDGALAAVPIPKKYAAAAKSVRAAALKAVNEPARQGRWAFRSVYKEMQEDVPERNGTRRSRRRR